MSDTDLLQLYEELLHVARVQSHAIDNGDEVALAQCVAQRDELMDRLEAAGLPGLPALQTGLKVPGELDGRAGEQAHQPPGSQPTQQQPDRQQTLWRLQQLIHGILDVDRENARKLVERMEQLQAESARLREGRKGRKGYEEPAAFEPRFIDRRS